MEQNAAGVGDAAALSGGSTLPGRPGVKLSPVGAGELHGSAADAVVTEAEEEKSGDDSAGGVVVSGAAVETSACRLSFEFPADLVLDASSSGIWGDWAALHRAWDTVVLQHARPVSPPCVICRCQRSCPPPSAPRNSCLGVRGVPCVFMVLTPSWLTDWYNEHNPTGGPCSSVAPLPEMQKWAEAGAVPYSPCSDIEHTRKT